MSVRGAIPRKGTGSWLRPVRGSQRSGRVSCRAHRLALCNPLECHYHLAAQSPGDFDIFCIRLGTLRQLRFPPCHASTLPPTTIPPVPQPSPAAAVHDRGFVLGCNMIVGRPACFPPGGASRIKELHNFGQSVFSPEMDRLKVIVSLLLLVLWMPVTSHCYLELAGLISKDDCCSQGESMPPGKGDPCASGCKLVEKAGYKIQNNRTVPTVVLLPLPVFSQPPLPQPAPEGFSARLVDWPPDTLHLQQFAARTALPARAPSFAS